MVSEVVVADYNLSLGWLVLLLCWCRSSQQEHEEERAGSSARLTRSAEAHFLHFKADFGVSSHLLVVAAACSLCQHHGQASPRTISVYTRLYP